MDIEWARDGRTGELYPLSAARDLTAAATHDGARDFHLKSHGKVLVKGRSVGEKIGGRPA